MAYIPDSGDIVWIMINPQAGYEQAGYRPELVLSPKVYNGKVGLAILCPITSHVKIPEGLEIGGAVLSDQVKSLDWKGRQAKFICKLPSATYNEVIQKFSTLIRQQLQSR